MAHFAQLDENNVVTQVIVVNNNDCLDSNGQESEQTGIVVIDNSKLTREEQLDFVLDLVRNLV